MAFATAQELSHYWANHRYYQNMPHTVEKAQEYIDQVHTAVMENKQGCKDDRPWRIVDLTAALDPTQPWIGFEFETGFDAKAHYQSFINFLWAQDHVAIDREGSGRYPVEVAYPPQNMSDVLAGNSLLQKSIEYIESNGLVPSPKPTTFTCRDIGIHAGLSTPNWRTAHYNDRTRAVDLLCRALDNELSAKQKQELYGRTALHWGTAWDRTSYIELKMFKSNPDPVAIKGFIDVVAKISDLVEYLLLNKDSKGIGNSYRYLSGKDKKIMEFEA